MTDANDRVRAADPSTPPEVLADLAYREAELRPVVAANPSAYPALLDWLAALGDSAIDSALSARATTGSMAEQAANPLTPQETLANIAYEHPDLRSVIAANPSAYPELLDWIAAASSATVGAESGTASPSPRPGKQKLRRPAFLTTRFMIIVASILVLAIVGGIIAAAANNAALTAQKVADQKAAAVADFENAAKVCKSANDSLKSAEANAATTATTDPSSLADPSLIDTLKASSTESSRVARCVVPQRAKGTEAMKAQTKSLRSATSGVNRAAVSLLNDIDAITASVQAKKDAAAAAAQAAAAAAAAAARTWHEDSGNGYTYDVSLTAGAPTTGTTASGQTVGHACTDFNPATDLAVPYTLNVTSTTNGFAIPAFTVQLYEGGFGDVSLGDGGWSIGSDESSTIDQGSYEAEEYYSGNQTECWQPAQSGSPGLLSVQWSDGLAAGASDTWNFTFIVKGYKSPAYPDGNQDLLANIGLSPQAQIGDNRAVALDNSIIGG